MGGITNSSSHPLRSLKFAVFTFGCSFLMLMEKSSCKKGLTIRALLFIQNIFLLACLLTLVLYYIADLMPNAWDLTFDAIFFIEKYSLWKIPLVHIKFDARFSSPFSPLSQWNHIKYEDWFHLNDSTDSNNDKKRQMKLVGCNKQRHCHQACV